MVKISFTEFVKKGIEIAKLNEKVVGDVAKDQKATNMAILFFAIGGALGGLLTFNPLIVLTGAVMGAAFSFVMVGILHILAKIFGGKATFMDYYRATGIGSIVSWPGAIPFLGFFFWIWSLVVNVVVLRKVHKLSTVKSVIVVLIPVVILAIIVAFFVAAFVALFAGVLGSGGLEALNSLNY